MRHHALAMSCRMCFDGILQSMHPIHLIRGWRNKPAAQHDLAIACFFVVLVYLAAWQWNLAEALYRVTSTYEFMQLDELPLALFAASVALAWFSHRRMHELKIEITRRMAAEQSQAALLAENRALAQHARQAQEEERKRMAREIHDEMGQYLTAIRLSAAILPAESDPLVAEHSGRISRHAEHIQIAVQNLMHRLRPVALDEYGLLDAVNHLAENWRQENPQTDCKLRLDQSCPILQDSLNIAVYRIIQEALTNVARHARASEVTITIAQFHIPSAHMLEIVIQDNGVGFDRLLAGPCFGLAGMRERIEAVGGTFHISGGVNAGVRVSAVIPLPLGLQEQS